MIIQEIISAPSNILGHLNPETILIYHKSHGIPKELTDISSDDSLGRITRRIVNYFQSLDEPSKLSAVKCLKYITNLGLKEAKDLVDNLW